MCYTLNNNHTHITTITSNYNHRWRKSYSHSLLRSTHRSSININLRHSCPSTPAAAAPPQGSAFLAIKREFRWPPQLAQPGFRKPYNNEERDEWMDRVLGGDTVKVAAIIAEQTPLLSPPAGQKKKGICEMMASCTVM